MTVGNVGALKEFSESSGYRKDYNTKIKIELAFIDCFIANN